MSTSPARGRCQEKSQIVLKAPFMHCLLLICAAVLFPAVLAYSEETTTEYSSQDGWQTQNEAGPILPQAPSSAIDLGLPDPSGLGSLDQAESPLMAAEQPTAVPAPLGSEDLVEGVPEMLPPFSLQSVFAVAAGGLGARPLSMRDVVALALANNNEIKIQRLQPDLGQQQIRFAKGAFDPQFSFSTQYSYSTTPQNAVEFISTGGLVGGFNDPRSFTAENYSLNWTLGGKTPLGTQYSVGLNQLQSRNDINIQIPPSLFFPEYTSVLGLTLTQPLLRGAGPAANLAELRIARVQKQIGWYDWQQQLISTLGQTVSLYLDLIFASENLKVREGAVRTARLLEEQNIRRVRAGKMRPADVWEAQTSVAANSDNALRAANAFIEAQNNLKARIFSLAEVSAGPTGRLEPVDDLRIPALSMDRSQFLQEAFSKRPEYLKVTAELEKEGIKVRYARNQVYPQVDLQAGYGLTGLEGDFGNSFDQVFEGEGPALSFGVIFSVPLGNQKELASLQSAKIKQQQALLGLEKTSIDITLDVDTAMGIAETTRKQVEVAAQTTVTAKLTAEAQEKLLEEGKSTTFDVVRLQNDFADASTRELAALANYRKAVLRLAVARGTLLEELGISLENEAERDSAPSSGLPVSDRGNWRKKSQGENGALQEATDQRDSRPRKPQGISFSPLPQRTFGDKPVKLNASATSEGSIEFSSSNTKVAKVEGSHLVIVGAGTATITARQSGGSLWAPAESSQLFKVKRAVQKVSFAAPRVPRFSPRGTFRLAAQASSGGAVRFTADPADVLSISGSLATMQQPGTVKITARQEGSANFEPAAATRQIRVR